MFVRSGRNETGARFGRGVTPGLAVPGLELPVKLRRALGQGSVVSAEKLAHSIMAFDLDKDGSVTRPELISFLSRQHVGGPWFCEVVAKTLWRYVEARSAREQPSIRVETLARIIHFVMNRGPGPERRYEITPEGMAGYKPLSPLKPPGQAASEAAGPDSGARPRATPKGPQSQRAPSTSQGRPQGASPRASARRPAPRRPGPRR